MIRFLGLYLCDIRNCIFTNLLIYNQYYSYDYGTALDAHFCNRRGLSRACCLTAPAPGRRAARGGPTLPRPARSGRLRTSGFGWQPKYLRAFHPKMYPKRVIVTVAAHVALALRWKVLVYRRRCHGWRTSSEEDRDLPVPFGRERGHTGVRPPLKVEVCPSQFVDPGAPWVAEDLVDASRKIRRRLQQQDQS